MTQATSPRRRFSLLAAPSTVVTAVLLLTGCAGPLDGDFFASDTPNSSQADSSESPAEPDLSVEPDNSADDEDADDESSESTAPGEGQVTFMLDGERFTFTPTTCVMDFGKELCVFGPGIADDSRAPAFLDIDIAWFDEWPKGTVFVYLDAKKAALTDDFFAGLIGEDGRDYSMGQMMDGFEVRTDFSTDDSFDMGTGVLMIDCG